MSKMQAIVYYAPEDIRVENYSIPVSGSDEIRVKIDACAVCGTDLKSMLVGNPRIKAPKVMGHEFTGIVETIGDKVDGFKIGDCGVNITGFQVGPG